LTEDAPTPTVNKASDFWLGELNGISFILVSVSIMYNGYSIEGDDRSFVGDTSKVAIDFWTFWFFF
jgi:uncharacterized membrane protein YcfT